MLFVGDRSGTIFRVDRTGEATTLASVPPSVAAFHLAFGPDGALYVTAPTLSPYDSVFRIDPRRHGHDPLYRVRAAAGDRLRSARRSVRRGSARRGERPVPVAAAGRHAGEPELVLAGPGLVGVAFHPNGGVVVCSSDTAYRLPRPHGT